jgi:hypothetical protein
MRKISTGSKKLFALQFRKSLLEFQAWWPEHEMTESILRMPLFATFI